MKHLQFACIIAVTSAALVAQDVKPVRVSPEQWAAIEAAQQAKAFAQATDLQAKIIADGTVALIDRLTALAGYFEHAQKKQAADPQQALAWVAALDQAPGHDGESAYSLTTLLLKMAVNDAGRKEAALKRAVAWDLLTMRRRCEFAGQLAKHHLLQTDDIPGAAKIVQALLEIPDLPERDILFVCKELGDIWKLAGKLEEAVAAYSIIYTQAPTQSNSAAKYVRDVYLAFGEPDKAQAHFMQHADMIEKAKIDRDLALKLLDDAGTDARMKKELFKIFLGNTTNDAAIRLKYAEVVADKSLTLSGNPFRGGGSGVGAGNDTSLGLGSYGYALELLGYGENTSWADTAAYALIKVKALAGLNRYDEIRPCIAAYLARPKIAATPKERHLLALVDAVIGLPDQAGFTKAVIDSVNAAEVFKEIAAADRGDNLVALASIVAHARKNDLARDVYGLYEALFVPQPRKTVTAVFCDAPVDSFETFLRTKETLKPELLDRKFKGDLEMIVATDIGSGGERAAALGAAEKSDALGKLYVLCDAEGLRFFFDIPDPDGLALGAGLAGRNHNFELFFAPGWNQPYVSSGVRYGTRTGGWLYQTTYDNIAQQRFEEGSPNFKTDVRYHEKGFYASFFFGWDAMFDKLPDAPEKFCEFDTLDWSPNGGYAWSSRLNVHSRLEWGRVHFNFTNEQLAKIRKRIIFKARREYLAEKERPNGPVDFWKDEALGDPAFHAAKVQPLVAQLDAHLPNVKTDMSADEIDVLYRAAVPGWKKLAYQIADLRAQYLEDSLTEE